MNNVKKVSKKNLKKEQSVINKPALVFGILSLLVILIVVIVAQRVISWQMRPVIETPKSEMKKIPPDVKAEMEKETFLNKTASVRVPVLMYHYVEYVQNKKDTIRQALDINPYTFEQQVKTLSGAGYTFITSKELGEILDDKMPLPKKPIVLSFDDGHWDFYTNVLPVLKKYHIKATAYIIPGFLGGSDFMTKQELREVVNSGLVDVGAHTVHHISLKGKLYPVVKYEVDESKAMLENEFHIKVVSFAYPDGTFDLQAINIVKDAGFTTAVSTVPGIEQSQQNRYFLYRLRPGYRVGQVLLNYLNQSSFKPF